MRAGSAIEAVLQQRIAKDSDPLGTFDRMGAPVGRTWLLFGRQNEAAYRRSWAAMLGVLQEAFTGA
jgi:hypothetical protein